MTDAVRSCLCPARGTRYVDATVILPMRLPAASAMLVAVATSPAGGVKGGQHDRSRAARAAPHRRRRTVAHRGAPAPVRPCAAPRGACPLARGHAADAGADRAATHPVPERGWSPRWRDRG